MKPAANGREKAVRRKPVARRRPAPRIASENEIAVATCGEAAMELGRVMIRAWAMRRRAA